MNPCARLMSAVRSELARVGAKITRQDTVFDAGFERGCAIVAFDCARSVETLYSIGHWRK